jgi:hypothetical protein
MLRWICDNTKRDQVQNDAIHERLRVTLVEEKLVQHHLRWFKQIQQRLTETPVHNDVIRRSNNEKRDRERSNLTWKKFVKRFKKSMYHQGASIRYEKVKAAINVSKPCYSIPSFYHLLSIFPPAHFHFFLSILLSFLLFNEFFLSSFIFPIFVILFYSYFFSSCGFISNLPNLLETKRLDCCCCC